MTEIEINPEIKLSETQKIKGFVWHNYKIKYAQDKRGFWVIVNYRNKKYFGFIEEGILGKAINDNQTHATLLKVIENIAEKIKRNYESK